MDFIPLKQPTDNTCGHTTLALIAGTTVQEVIDWFGHDSGLTSKDMLLFLAYHGIYVGFCGMVGGDYFTLKSEDGLIFRRPVKGYPPILTVQSEAYQEQLH